MDAQSAVSSKQVQTGYKCADLIHGIRGLPEGPSTVRFSHVFRTANTCADYLAKKGVFGGQVLE